MREKAVAEVYAKGVYQLGKEQKVAVVRELSKLNQVIDQNNDLETVLFMDVFTLEEKHSVISAVIARLKLSPLISHIFNFLLAENRIAIFPLLYKNLVVLDELSQGFLTGSIEGRSEKLPSNERNTIVQYLKTELEAEIKLDYQKRDDISAGYRVTVGDLQLDASLDRQLEQLKEG